MVLVFANRFRHLVARLFFTKAIWAAHARQEMAALARLIELRYIERMIAKPALVCQDGF